VVGLSVCLSVGRSVGHVPEPYKNGSTDQDAVSVLTPVGPRNHVLDGVNRGLSAQLKSMGNFCLSRLARIHVRILTIHTVTSCDVSPRKAVPLLGLR